MGWSCRIEASETLEKIQKLLNQDYNINLGNGMPDGFYNVNSRCRFLFSVHREVEIFHKYN